MDFMQEGYKINEAEQTVNVKGAVYSTSSSLPFTNNRMS